MINLEFEIPSIFPKSEIKAGVTTRNLDIFSKKGFSLKSKISEQNNKIGELESDSEFEENSLILASNLGILRENLIFQKQTHGIIIREVSSGSSIEESDGMICSQKNIFICIKIADCCAILIYDKNNKVICGLHSGWKGTKENITKIGLDILKNKYNSKTEDLLVWLSPAACGACYELDWDVAQYFENYISQKSDGKYLFDNRLKIKDQLLDFGILEEHIEISKTCTIENINYHSFRRDKENSGRMAAFIGMI